MSPYGYYTSAGFSGRLPDGEWMLFAALSDYLEYISEEEEEQKDDVA